jgi:hypothetical protein
MPVLIAQALVLISPRVFSRLWWQHDWQAELTVVLLDASGLERFGSRFYVLSPQTIPPPSSPKRSRRFSQRLPSSFFCFLPLWRWSSCTRSVKLFSVRSFDPRRRS